MGGRYNRQKALAPLDTTGTTSANEPAVNGGASEVVGLGDMEDHIQTLKQVSETTKNLMNLLGGQLQELSATIPVLRGFDIVCVRFRHVIVRLSERRHRRRNSASS